MSIPNVKVVGRLGSTIIDGLDPDDDQDVIYAESGTIRLTPLIDSAKVAEASPAPLLVVNAPVDLPLDAEGYVSLRGQRWSKIIDLTSGAVNPAIGSGKATHRMDYIDVTFQGKRVKLASQNIRIAADAVDPATGAVDLFMATEVPTAGGIGIVIGPRGEAGPEGPEGPAGGSDAATAEWVETGPLTKAALSATIARGAAINALDHGVKADGVTNDAPAWNALILSLEGTGTTVTWTGRSVLDQPISWKRGVSLVGQGWGRSVLATRGVNLTVANDCFAAIEGFNPYVSAAAPFEDLTFRDFEVDGSQQVALFSGPSIRGKAIFMLFMRRCQFVGLYLHDTIGTALGCDYLPQTLIHGVIAERGGSGWTGSEGGHAGIGIGTGQYEIEDVTISDCHAVDCGHWGIFTEYQSGHPYHSKGARIVNCSATGTRGTGIADIGNIGTVIEGCFASGNGIDNNGLWRDGIGVYQDASETVVRGNTSVGNIGDGICIKGNALGNLDIHSNQTGRNGRRGIMVETGTAIRDGYSVSGNRAWSNGYSGISIGTSGATPKATVISGNRCYNNGALAMAGQDRGISIDGGIAGGLVAGNVCYDDQATKTQRYGIAVPSGVFTNTLMTANVLDGNATGPFASAGATLTSLVRRNNVGYVTESRGAGTIPAGASTVTVLHGLSENPAAVVVTPRRNEGAWVTTLGAGGFIVERAGTTGALDFTWSAQA